jgi:sugar lactone lactonase YvrE
MKVKLIALAAGALLATASAYSQSVSTALSTNLFEPSNIDSDTADLYISDSGNNRIVKFIPSTGVVAPLAGRLGTVGSADGTNLFARFNQPRGVVLARGGLVVADYGNHTIRFVSLNGVVTTIAGAPGQAGSVDADGLSARFRYPAGLAADNSGNIYVADSKNNAIRMIDPNNNVITLATGFYEPAAVAVGDNGDLWVADTREHVVQRITRSNGIVTGVSVMAGQLGAAGSADGLDASFSELDSPKGLLWLGNAGLLISDTGNDTIRRLFFDEDINTWAVQTVAGSAGVPGKDDGTLTGARFNSPVGIARDPHGEGFFLVDRANNSVRRLQTTPPQPPVDEPVIGYVIFPPPDYTSVLVKVTTATFNNDVLIHILHERGTEAFFTEGPTPKSTFEDTIPNPSSKTGISPPAYSEGLSKSEVPPSMTAPKPDFTIKAIGSQDGRQSSPIAKARFQFKVANTQISGDNAALFTITNITFNSTMFYTIDGSDPTNVADGSRVFQYDPLFPISLNVEKDVTFKVRGFRPGYAPSDIITKIFTKSNFVANLITFGFASGEASSSYIAAPGQRFFAPVTLSVLPEQKMYSLQYNVAITNLGLVPVDLDSINYDTMLLKPHPTRVGFFLKIPPAMWDETNKVMRSLLFVNPETGLLGVGYIERGGSGSTNLYPTVSQDLITRSQAHDTTFFSKNGKVIVGSYSFKLPTSAALGDEYEIRLGRPTATDDGISHEPLILAPTNGVVGAGAINAVKRVTVAITNYIVGDVTPFRWFNSGDFGDGYLKNNDVVQTFQSAVYRLNTPPRESDLFNAMDSADGQFVDTFETLSNAQIDSMFFGDGELLIDDVYVTYRRSLDPTLSWIARQWGPAGLTAYVVPNREPGSGSTNTPPPAVVLADRRVSAPEKPANSSVAFRIDDAIVGGNRTVVIPVRATISGEYPLRVLLLGLHVTPLQGSPAITEELTFTAAPQLGEPVQFPLPDGVSPADSYAAAWLNDQVTGIKGDAIIGYLTIKLPDTVTPLSAYLVSFDHVSGSPNGGFVFNQSTRDGVLTIVDRSNSSWNDGISDLWRLRYFASTVDQLSAPGVDADGDGMTNQAEFLAGTNPNDRTSRLNVEMRSQGGQTIRLRWPSILNQHYVIEASPLLSGNHWHTISTNIVGNGGINEFIQENSGNDTFFRVRAE